MIYGAVGDIHAAMKYLDSALEANLKNQLAAIR
jgi:hypothetical protein